MHASQIAQEFVGVFDRLAGGGRFLGLLEQYEGRLDHDIAPEEMLRLYRTACCEGLLKRSFWEAHPELLPAVPFRDGIHAAGHLGEVLAIAVRIEKRSVGHWKSCPVRFASVTRSVQAFIAGLAGEDVAEKLFQLRAYEDSLLKELEDLLMKELEDLLSSLTRQEQRKRGHDVSRPSV